MLDHDDGFAILAQFLDDGNNAGNFRQAQPRKQFIQNDQIRIEGNRFCQFQPLQISLGQHTGCFVGDVGIPFKSDLFKQIQRYRVPVTILPAGHRFDPRRIKGNNHVFIGRQLVERFNHLKGPGNSHTYNFIGSPTGNVPAVV